MFSDRLTLEVFCLIMWIQTLAQLSYAVSTLGETEITLINYIIKDLRADASEQDTASVSILWKIFCWYF